MRLLVILVVVLLPSLALAQIADTLDPLATIQQFENATGDPTALNFQYDATHTASGLYMETITTWNANAAAAGLPQVGPGTAYANVAALSADLQQQGAAYLYQQQGFGPWICAGCNAQLAAYINSVGGPPAFGLTAAEEALLGAAANGNGTPGVGPVAGALLGGGHRITDHPGTGTGAGQGVLDDVANQFQQAMKGWQGGLLNIATDLFWLLATITLAIALIFNVLEGGGTQGTLVTFIRWLFSSLIFLWLLQHGSEFGADIVNSLTQAGTTIGGSPMSPSAIAWNGVTIFSTIWNNHEGFLGELAATPVMIAAIPIAIAFALAAVWALMALIEAYFKIGLAALFLSFGAFPWTRDIAISLLRGCLSVGFKLMTLELITALGTGLTSKWAQNSAGLSMHDIGVMLVGSIAFAALTKVIPDSMERMVLGGGGTMADWRAFRNEATGYAALGVASVAGIAGVPVLAAQLYKHAAEQITSQPNDQQSGSGATRSLQFGGSMTQAAVRAVGSELSGRLGGIYRGGPSATIARAVSHVGQQRRIATAERSRPAPPSGNSTP